VKVFSRRAHEHPVGRPALGTPPLSESAQPADFTGIYTACFHVVERWVHALGGPDCEGEDLTQEVFLVVRRKLDRFDGRNLRGWLYAITARTVSDYRRRAWFRHCFVGRREVELDELPRAAPGPAEECERAEAQRLLYRLLGRMSEKRRTAFVLFELEGYTGEEIAELLGIPVATVWTRLHHARREFLARVAELNAERDQAAAPLAAVALRLERGVRR
jgi:RNA polymerase sigma-70 factor (ECF subfamily)